MPPKHTKSKIARIIDVLSGDARFSRNLALLTAGRSLQRLALGSFGVFVPIYFFTQFNQDIAILIAIFVGASGLYLLGIPLFAPLLSILGTRALMLIANAAAVGTAFAFVLFPENPALAALAFLATNVVFRLTYWLPYHVSLSSELDPAHRGSQLAFLVNVQTLLLALMPLVGGFLITGFGFETTFLIAGVIALFAFVPLWYIDTTYERFSWGYIDTFVHLFKRENRSLLLSHFANGAQTTALLIFWPIYLYMLLDGGFTAVGLITTLTVFAVIVLRWFTGALFDLWGREKVMRVGVLLESTGWAMKLFVQSPAQIVMVDTYHNFGQSVNRVAFDAATYEQAADNGRYVDEYTALKEMAMHMGRICMLLVAGLLLAYFDLRVVFVLAALITLGMILVGKRQSVV